MSGVRWLARAAVRGRLVALGSVALLIALGLGVSIAALTTAWRTETAYPAYLADAEVGDLVVNPSLLTDRMVDRLGATPQVRELRTDSVLVATVDSGQPRLGNRIDVEQIQVRYSADGRYVEQDRPVVHQGRMVRSGSEAFLNVGAATALGVGVGDTIPLSFWWSGIAQFEPQEIQRPIGVTRVRVVGIGVFANEVLADELYSRANVLVTDDVAARYDCTPRHPDSDIESVELLSAQLFPPGCALAYRYFSMQVADGGLAAATAAVDRMVVEENARLPEALLAVGGYFSAFPTSTAEERTRVERSLAPSVLALQMVGLTAAAATCVLGVLTVARQALQLRSPSTVWAQLGATRRQRVAGITLPHALVLAIGFAGAVVVGWALSWIGPVASARAVQPRPELILHVPVVVGVLGGALLVLGAGLAVASMLATRPEATPRVGSRLGSRLGRLSRRSSPADVAARTGNVAFALGIRAAVTGSGAVVLIAAAVAATSMIVGSAVFGTNLSGMVNNPSRFGWPYDLAVMVGSGYGGANESLIATNLRRPEIASWGIAAMGSAVVDGQNVPFVADRVGFDRLPFQVVRGTLPRTADQVALGASTAQRLHLDVGDQATVAVAHYGQQQGTVTGIVVLPPVGPILTDRAGLGTGILLSGQFFERAFNNADRPDGSPVAEPVEQQGSFIAINLHDGVDSQRFLASVQPRLSEWDTFENRPRVYLTPVRPGQIADVAAMRSAPILLAALLSVAMAAALTIAVALAVRTRQRELAILRALGATRHLIAATLRWQALAIVATGLLVGLPLGVAAGRFTWTQFATELGIPPAPAVSIPWLAGFGLAALAVAVLASALPSRIAARISPAAELPRD